MPNNRIGRWAVLVVALLVLYPPEAHLYAPTLSRRSAVRAHRRLGFDYSQDTLHDDLTARLLHLKGLDFYRSYGIVRVLVQQISPVLSDVVHVSGLMRTMGVAMRRKTVTTATTIYDRFRFGMMGRVLRATPVVSLSSRPQVSSSHRGCERLRYRRCRYIEVCLRPPDGGNLEGADVTDQLKSRRALLNNNSTATDPQRAKGFVGGDELEKPQDSRDTRFAIQA